MNVFVQLAKKYNGLKHGMKAKLCQKFGRMVTFVVKEKHFQMNFLYD